MYISSRNWFGQFAIYWYMNKAIAVKLNPTKMHSMAISHIVKYTHYRG
jgi:hypothetical protein